MIYDLVASNGAPPFILSLTLVDKAAGGSTPTENQLSNSRSNRDNDNQLLLTAPKRGNNAPVSHSDPADILARIRRR